ncbi:MAG TPA: hypothetical protein VH502_14800 [Actinoplanes sp.]
MSEAVGGPAGDGGAGGPADGGAGGPAYGGAATGTEPGATGGGADGLSGGSDAADVDPNAIDADPGTDDGPPSAPAADVLRALRKAAASLNVGGDQVGGNKYVLLAGDRQSAPLREVDAALSEPVRNAFVDPENWEHTRTAFRDRRLIVLRGRPGHGRVAAAIRLLQAPSNRPIYSLDRDVDLYRFPQWLDTDAAGDDPLPLGAGYLLCDPPDRTVLQGPILQQVATALDRRDARMVITVDGDLVPADDVRDFVVPLGRAPAHDDVLANHLRWRLRERPDTDEAAADRILAAEEMRAFLGDAMAGDAPVKVAANLAMMIDQQFDGFAVDMDRLRDQQAERVVEDFDIWFGALPDIRTRSLAIALAVLNGLQYEHVARAAGRLCDELDGPPQVVSNAMPMLRPPWRDPFATTLRENLRMLRARTRLETEPGTFGPTVIEVVEYIDADRPRTVLDHVWHQYHLQRPLLDWLTGLATDPHKNVRSYVGTALGVLSTFAFDFVYAYALGDMAIGDNRWGRDVVAYALRVPVRDEKLFPLVRRTANRLHGTVTPQARATSARIRGLALGPLNAPNALEFLGLLALVNDRRVASAVADSLADLLVDDEDKHGPDVLRHVVAWQEDRRRTLAGQFVFVQLAGVITNVDMTKSDATRPDWHVWPELLLLADRRRELRPLLVAAWARVLNSGAVQHGVATALDNWAGLAESYSEVRTAFVRLMAATAATSPRTRAILLRHAFRWRAPEEVFPNPETAAAVETALKARNDTP